MAGCPRKSRVPAAARIQVSSSSPDLRRAPRKSRDEGRREERVRLHAIAGDRGAHDLPPDLSGDLRRRQPGPVEEHRGPHEFSSLDRPGRDQPNPLRLTPGDVDPQRLRFREGRAPAVASVQIRRNPMKLGDERRAGRRILGLVEQDGSSRDQDLGRAEPPERALDPALLQRSVFGADRRGRPGGHDRRKPEKGSGQQEPQAWRHGHSLRVVLRQERVKHCTDSRPPALGVPTPSRT